MTSSSKLLTIFLTLGSVTILDQASKWFVMASNFPSICNSGFALGISSNLPVLLISLVVLFYVGYCLFREKRTANFIGFSMILGGGISNIIDRLIRGCVVDFIHVPFFPSFNVADAAITLGVLLLLLAVANNYGRS